MANVKDPVCGMVIDSQSARWQSEYQGDMQYFCSETCLRQFQLDPSAFVSAGGAAEWSPRPRNAETPGSDDREREKHEPPWTTRHGITAPKFGSAGSGGAEYELLPEAHERPKRRGRRKKS
jgi:Cu+-exporting ATPase